VRLAKYQGRKHEQVGVVIFPGLLGQARFDAHLFQECLPIPAFFRGHLGKQHTLILSLADQQAMLAYMNLVDVLDFAQRGKHRDLVLQQRQFVGIDGAEAPVLESREGGHIPDRFGKGFNRGHIANTAAQISVLLQGHEGATRITERFRLIVGYGQDLLLPHRDFHGLAGNSQQLLFFGGGEGELRVLVAVLLVLLLIVSRDRQGSVTDHAALVSRNVARIGVFEESRVMGAQVLRCNHGCDDGPAAARTVPEVPLEVLGESQVIPILDGLQDLVVHPLCVIVSVVMGQIGADQDERVGALYGFGESDPQGAAVVVTDVAHHDGHHLELSQHALKERQLILESVLAVLLASHIHRAVSAVRDFD